MIRQRAARQCKYKQPKLFAGKACERTFMKSGRRKQPVYYQHKLCLFPQPFTMHHTLVVTIRSPT